MILELLSKMLNKDPLSVCNVSMLVLQACVSHKFFYRMLILISYSSDRDAFASGLSDYKIERDPKSQQSFFSSRCSFRFCLITNLRSVE